MAETISEHASVKMLAARVIDQAVADLSSRDPLIALDAALFLADDYRYSIWADPLDRYPMSGILLLTSGRAKRYNKSRRRTHAKKTKHL